MSNHRTVENYYTISTKQFQEYLKIGKVFNAVYTFTQSRRMGSETQIINQEEVQVVVNGVSNFIILGGRKIYFELTPCHYGGHRYWFRCPHCCERCTRLFFTGQENGWHCRRCGGLVYRSQQQNKQDFMAWYDKAEKVARQLDSNYSAVGFDYLFTPPMLLFPDKPANMHYKTYERLYQKYLGYVTKGNQLDKLAMDKLIGRI